MSGSYAAPKSVAFGHVSPNAWCQSVLFSFQVVTDFGVKLVHPLIGTAQSTGFSVFSCQNVFRSCGLVKKWCLIHAGFHEKRDVSAGKSITHKLTICPFAGRLLLLAHLTEGGLLLL